MRTIEDIEFEELFGGTPRHPRPKLDYSHNHMVFLGHFRMADGRMQDVYLTDCKYEQQLVVLTTPEDVHKAYRASFYDMYAREYAPIADHIERKVRELGWEGLMRFYRERQRRGEV